MDRFFEGSRSANESASAPCSLPSCQSSHRAKASGSFLLQTLPDVLYSSFQKHTSRKAGTVFPRWHRKAYLSSMPDRNQQKERNKRISSNKAIHPHTGRHRFLLTISLYWGPPWSDIRLTAKYGMSHLIYFIAFMHRFHCTFCAHFFHNSEFQQIIVVICSFSLLLFLE